MIEIASIVIAIATVTSAIYLKRIAKLLEEKAEQDRKRKRVSQLEPL